MSNSLAPNLASRAQLHFTSIIRQSWGNEVNEEVTGMYMLDEEGEIITREVKAKFVNGKPAALEVMYIMNSNAEWERFLRFMERYSADNGLGLKKAE